MRISKEVFTALDDAERRRFHKRLADEYRERFPSVPDDVAQLIEDDIRDNGRDWGARHEETFRSLYFLSFSCEVSIFREEDFRALMAQSDPEEHEAIINAIADKLQRDMDLL